MAREVETILENEYVTLVFYPTLKIVHHTFHRFLEGEVFREAMETGVQLLRENGATKWLSDDRKNAALPQADVDWGLTDWFPRARAAGWQHWGVVMPENVLGQMNMRRFIEPYSKQGLTVRLFPEPQAALAWLKSL
jgi:hypothetical protein